MCSSIIIICAKGFIDDLFTNGETDFQFWCLLTDKLTSHNKKRDPKIPFHNILIEYPTPRQDFLYLLFRHPYLLFRHPEVLQEIQESDLDQQHSESGFQWQSD